MPNGLFSGPPEATSQTCPNGCGMGLREDSYECKAKACKKDNLCVGCVYTCAVCADEFCFDDVKDVHPESEDKLV